MMWQTLYDQIRAIEIVQGLNARGRIIARYLERRARRSSGDKCAAS